MSFIYGCLRLTADRRRNEQLERRLQQMSKRRIHVLLYGYME
ncbi:MULTISPECIES: hypothetical protein [unclassified Paenibacillus]